MRHTVKSLMEQVHPPNTAPESGDWSEVEAKLGLALPDDYKAIVEIYGDCKWGDY